MKSASEEHCRCKFDEFLRKVSSTPPSWRDVPLQEEPPDYYVTVGKVEYAVEVTILMGSVSIGSTSWPELGVRAALGSFVNQVERAADQAGCLHGFYIINLHLPIENFTLVKDQVQQALLAYMQETRGAPGASEKVVFQRGNQSCSILKEHNYFNGIGKRDLPAGRPEGEIAAEICALLEERLTTKRGKLYGISNPKILLLHDLYHWAQPEKFRDCLGKLDPLLENFYAVYVVQEETEGFLLYSSDGAWIEGK